MESDGVVCKSPKVDHTQELKEGYGTMLSFEDIVDQQMHKEGKEDIKGLDLASDKPVYPLDLIVKTTLEEPKGSSEH